MSKRGKDLKGSIAWINNLEEKKRKIILNVIELDGAFRLENADILNINTIMNFIIEEFENVIEKSDIISKLVKAGLKEEDASIIVDYSENMILDMKASEIIKNMSLDDFEKIVLFILNKIHLYRETSFMAFEEFIDILNFKNEIEAKQVLILINTYIRRIVIREMNIENVRDAFTKIYEFNIEYTNLFEKIISENLEELRSAYIIYRLCDVEEFIRNIQEKIDNIEDTIVDHECDEIDDK